jgi:hypothetical protein
MLFDAHNLLFALLFVGLTAATRPQKEPPKLFNVTALGAKDGKTTIECWQLANPFLTSSQIGTPGAAQTQLSPSLLNMSYTVVPAGYTPGLHNVPAVQWGLWITGGIHITLPNSTEYVNFTAGQNAFILVTDTPERSALGHDTYFLKETVLIQIPIKDDVIPEHKSLHMGGCTDEEVVAGGVRVH